MGINFPSPPTEGQVVNVSPGKSFVFRNGYWRLAPLNTALPKNYIINPSMQISQQNGTTLGTTNGYFPADQWWHQYNVLTTRTGLLSNNSRLFTPYNISWTPQVAKGSLAAGDYAFLEQRLEGSRTADLMWGTSQAKSVVLRIAVSLAAGTYTVAIRNADVSRSYVSSFVVPGGGDREFIFVIPGCTDGVWPTGNVFGMSVSICPSIGSTFHAPAVNQGSNGNYLGIAGMSNFATSTGNSAYLGQIGLYADPYKTGIAPDFKLPNYAEELRRCQRYWYRCYGTRGLVQSATQSSFQTMLHPAQMRVIPTITIVGTPRIYDGGGTPAITAFYGNASNEAVTEPHVTCAAGGLTAGRIGIQYWSAETDYLAVSARM